MKEPHSTESIQKNAPYDQPFGQASPISLLRPWPTVKGSVSSGETDEILRPHVNKIHYRPDVQSSKESKRHCNSCHVVETTELCMSKPLKKSANAAPLPENNQFVVVVIIS